MWSLGDEEPLAKRLSLPFFLSTTSPLALHRHLPLKDVKKYYDVLAIHSPRNGLHLSG